MGNINYSDERGVSLVDPCQIFKKKFLSYSIPVKSINPDADEKNGKIWQYHLHSWLDPGTDESDLS